MRLVRYAVNPRAARRVVSTLLAAVCVVASASGRAQPPVNAESAERDLEVVLLGQALIKHDPRQYFPDPLASIRQVLSGADVVFTNLEVAICAPKLACEPTRNDIYFHGTQPLVLDYLTSIGVNLLSLANNHAWDYGAKGVLAAVEEAGRRGIVHAGSGRDIAAAVRPAVLATRAGRVALVAAATARLKPEAAATDARVGLNVLGLEDTEAWERNLASIREARRSADVVVFYQHFQTIGTPEWQQLWARAAVDAGADIYVSHGAPTLSGIELRGRSVIFYGLGNFIFHSQTPIGEYERDVWESVVVRMTLGADGGQKIRLVPITLDEGTAGELFVQTRGLPRRASAEQGEAILRRLVGLSTVFGTQIAIVDGEGQVVVPER